jgi:hypothetical protein
MTAEERNAHNAKWAWAGPLAIILIVAARALATKHKEWETASEFESISQRPGIGESSDNFPPNESELIHPWEQEGESAFP